jgi:glycosyltransferase involved in cell wall biosynthesis
MLNNLAYMAKHGHEAYCISGPDEELAKLAKENNVHFIPVNIFWGYASPFTMYRNIKALYKIFKREKIDVIQYATSNAALSAVIAGCLAKVPVRIRLQWGISYHTFTGIKRWFYRSAMWLDCHLSTHVQPDSYGNLKFSIQDGLYPASKGSVVMNGSATGVDLKKYDFSQRENWRRQIRERYQVSQDAKVIGFVGGVVKDKGIDELLEAYMNVATEKTCLMVVGGMPDHAGLNPELLEKAKKHPSVIFVGQVPNAAQYFAAFDFMTLPSYHEGFGMVVLESAAMGTPPIITNIKGPTDFVIDGENGIICEVKSAKSLEQAFRRALNMTPALYSELADHAYHLVKDNYDAEAFKEAFLKDREKLYAERCSHK